MEVAELGAASGLEDEGLIALKKEFFKKMTSMCHLHGKKIEYYCETCKELACETCFYSGYHSNPVLASLTAATHRATVGVHSRGEVGEGATQHQQSAEAEGNGLERKHPAPR
jgi:hypothetical protein